MQISHLSRADRADAVEVLADAFHDYPVMRFVLRDAGHRYEEHLRALVGFFCDKRLARAWPLLGVRGEHGLVGVAGVDLPEAGPGPPAVRHASERIARNIGVRGWERLQRYETESDLDAAAESHVFLGIVGVAGAAQGQGVARLLLDTVHALSAQTAGSTGVCLNTEDRTNVEMYERFGYRVIGDRDVGDLHTWCMFRPNDA